jgi:tRNA-specific 2-thiouridylase
MKGSVILGFSGGIDSCTAARLLLNEGYEVTALTIECIDDKTLMSKAQQRAEEIGVRWMGYDARDEFKREIIDYFCNSYQAGLTPAPCTRCNPRIKWQILERVADELGVEHIATGHYFNVVERNGHYYVAKGADSTKDQSYYLWGLTQKTLSRAITPMGNMIKSEVKQGFADKSESMGVCFLQGRSYASFLAERGVNMEPGDIVDGSGRVLGRHSGIARYTIGQRRGDGLTEGMRVVGIDAERNNIIVGKAEELYKHTLYIKEYNIVDCNELIEAKDITIKIRGIGRNPEFPVRIIPYDDGYKIVTQDPAWAPAKGQPLVLYRNELVIGGGIVVNFE